MQIQRLESFHWILLIEPIFWWHLFWCKFRFGALLNGQFFDNGLMRRNECISAINSNFALALAGNFDELCLMYQHQYKCLMVFNDLLCLFLRFYREPLFVYRLQRINMNMENNELNQFVCLLECDCFYNYMVFHICRFKFQNFLGNAVINSKPINGK